MNKFDLMESQKQQVLQEDQELTIIEKHLLNNKQQQDTNQNKQKQKIEQQHKPDDLNEQILHSEQNQENQFANIICILIDCGIMTTSKINDNSQEISSKTMNTQKNINCNKQHITEQETTNCNADQIIEKIFNCKPEENKNNCEIFRQQFDQELLKRKYILKEPIAKGCQGYVFRDFFIDEKGNQQNYAFKIYKNNNDNDEKIFKKEFNLLNELCQYSNILKIFDQFTESIKDNQNQEIEKFNILVMELCQFDLYYELCQFIQTQQFSFDQLLKIIFDLLDALIKLRSHKIIHSDIKNKNILKNQKDEYCFSDFGFSQKKERIDDKLKLIGKSDGFTPEEEQKSKSISYKLDVYSLGKVFTHVIYTFQEANKNKNITIIIINILKEFQKIIEEKMIKLNIQERKSIKKIHRLFFKQINKIEFIEFNFSYLQKLQQQNKKNSEQLKNQDFFYQEEITHYYRKIELSILKNINLYSESNHIKDTNISCQQENIGKFQKEFLEKLIIFEKNLLPQIIQHERYISWYYSQKIIYNLVIKEFIEFLDVEEDWLIEIAQQFITNLFKVFKENEFNIDVSTKGKKKLKSIIEKLKIQENKEYEYLALKTMYLANYYFNNNKMCKANKYLKQSLDFEKQIQKDNHFLQVLQKGYGQHYNFVQKFEDSEKYLKQSLQYFEELQNKDKSQVMHIIEIYFTLGCINIKKGNFQDAQKIFFKAIQIEKQFLECDHLHFQLFIYYLGYSIYMQNREYVPIKQLNVNYEAITRLEELKKYGFNKFNQNDINKLSTIEKLQNAINDCYLDDNQKQEAFEYILEYIKLKS